jgi:hypothetical protein
MDIKRELLFYHETSSHLNKRIQKSHFLFRLSILNIHIITAVTLLIKNHSHIAREIQYDTRPKL